MKPNQTLPILATLAPAALVAPPILIAVAIGAGLIWLLTRTDEPTQLPTPEQRAPVVAQPSPGALSPPAHSSTGARRRIMREDVAEALEYGERAITRAEAVAALQNLGFQKTAAYKALSPEGRFGELLEHTPDGLISWQG